MNASKLLVQLGANIDLGDISEKSILQYAMESHNEHVIAYFTELEKKKTKLDTDAKHHKSIGLPIDKYTVKKQKIITLTKNKIKTDKTTKRTSINTPINEKVYY